MAKKPQKIVNTKKSPGKSASSKSSTVKSASSKAIAPKASAVKAVPAKSTSAKSTSAKPVAKATASKAPATKAVVASKPASKSAVTTAKIVSKEAPKAASKGTEKLVEKSSAKNSSDKASTKASAKVAAVASKPIQSVPGKIFLTQRTAATADAFNAAARKAATKNGKGKSAAGAVTPPIVVTLKPKKLRSKLAPKPEPIPVKLPPAPVTSDAKMAKNRAGLSMRELETFRDLLLAKRRELLGDMTSMEREALRSTGSNLSNLPVHMADMGTDNYEQEFTLGLVEKDRKLLKEINNALAKIQDGSYGLCEGTNKPISKPRLEAYPWARYSIEHARSLEKPMFGNIRRLS